MIIICCLNTGGFRKTDQSIRIPPAKPKRQLKELRRPPGDLRPPLLGAQFEGWTIGISRILTYLKQTSHVQWDLKDQNSDFEVTNWILSWNDTWKQWGWLDYAWFQWKVMEHIGKLGLPKWSVPKLYQQSRRIQHPVAQASKTSRFAAIATEIEAMWRTNMIVDHLAWG